ncbi:MAG: hypothetical protein Pg6B_01860 [Candidatus Azobacteroides pseudotrichonymphae]|jgi:hypothetical protein|nr:MAG: hypothetical protein Pg6B_01860 [Candidatus Azobacteroides pseudotrichonymphae]
MPYFNKTSVNQTRKITIKIRFSYIIYTRLLSFALPKLTVEIKNTLQKYYHYKNLPFTLPMSETTMSETIYIDLSIIRSHLM